ncbi:hypothetical protein K4K58_002581 [Colletotrichum sp. SAR11_239]|nr:hypothetical protein K4K58_002581 [Colletotrichum sp. SAR11_239]
MEAFGLVSSVITVVETSWKVIGFLEGVKHGGKSRRALLEEVTLLWLVFRRLKEEIDLPTGKQAHEPWVEPLKILDGPRGISAQIREQLNDLEAQLTPPIGRFHEAMSNLRWPFQEKEVTRIVSRLQELKQTTILVIQQSGHRMSREMQGELSCIKNVVEDTFLKKLLAWLTPLNFSQKQQEILGSADPYTCHVLKSKRFKLWHEHDLRSLWCWGAPGAGKSVVAASVYADVTKREELNTRDESYVILDGLDEVSNLSERDAMVKAIHNIGASVKVFITSRHSEDITEAIEATQTCKECHDSNAEMYTKSLERMEQSLRPKHYGILKKLLLWIAWGQRPLSIIELGHALAIYPGIEDIDEEDILPIRQIATWSAGLLFVDGDDFLRVIHPTTSRFFEGRRHELYPKGDSVMAHDCLHYLNMKILRAPLEGPDRRSLFIIRRKQYPLIDYAVLNCFKHVARSREKGEIKPTVEFLLSDALKPFIQALHYVDAKWTDDTDASALHVAVYFGITDVVSKLIDEGEDPNARDSFGATPLMYAAARGSDGLPELKRLLEAGADPALICNFGSTTLIRAVKLGAVTLVAELMRQTDININATPSSIAVHSALITATRLIDPSIIKILVARQDIDINLRNRHKVGECTPLHAAVYWRNLPAAKHLLAHKDIKVDSRDLARNETPFFYSARVGLTDFMELLLDHGANINEQDNNSGNALMRAVDYDESEAVELLVKRGIDTTHRDVYGRTALHSSSCNRSWRSMEYLLHVTDLDVNLRGRSGETPLHDSAWKLDARGASILVNAGARCDIKNSDGQTPVDIVMLRNRPDILDILRRAKGYIESAPDARLQSSLSDAVIGDPSDVLRSRIAKATLQEINASSAFAGTALHEACRHGRADVVEMLLRAGADMSVTNSFGRTPIDKAIKYGQLDCIKVLFKHDVDPERRLTSDGHMWEFACKRHHLDIALALVEAANVDKSSDYLQKALDGAAMDDKVAITRRLVGAETSKTFPADADEPPPDGGLQAWTQALMAHLVVVNTWGTINSFGIFQTFYRDYLSRPASDISWIGSMQVFFLFVAGVFTGRLTDAGYFRTVFGIGSALVVLGSLTASFATEYWQLFLSQGLCIGLGMGGLFCPVMAVLSTYFKRRRNLAIGIAISGSATGGMIYPVMARQLLPKIGFGWTMRVMALVQLVTLLVANIFMRSRLRPRRAGSLVELSAFKEKPYLLFTIGMFFNFWGVYFAFY